MLPADGCPPGAFGCWLAAWGHVCVIDLISARVRFDGGRLGVGLSVDG
jgi:hypothetical protein